MQNNRIEGLSVDAVSLTIYTAVNMLDSIGLIGNSTVQYDQDGRVTKIRGRRGNLNVNFGLDFLRLSGSPGRYMYSTNVKPCGPTEMAAFAKQIAQDFAVPLDAVLASETTRLDVALNVLVDHPVPAYFDVLGKAPYLRRDSMYDTSLYYRQPSNGRLLRIYDKLREVKDKASAQLRKQLDAEPGDVINVIRLESEIRSAKKIFQRPVTLGDLSTPTFWPLIEQHWRQQFDSVERIRGGSVSLIGPAAPTTPAELRKVYAALGIAELGGRDEAAARIRANVTSGCVDRAQGYRQIKMLDEALAARPDGPSLTDLADELDAGIERSLAVGAFWR